MRISQNYSLFRKLIVRIPATDGIAKVINEEWNVRNTDSIRSDIRNNIKN